MGASDGWTDLRADHRMDWSYDAAPARQRRPDRAALADRAEARPAPHARARLRSGPPGAAARPRPHHCGTASSRSTARYARGWHDYLDSLRRPARAPRASSAPTTTSADGARRQRGQDVPRRVIASPSMAVGVGHDRRLLGAVSPRVVARPLPDRDRAAGGRRPPRRRARPRLPLGPSAAVRRLLPAELQPRRHAALAEPAARRGRRPDPAVVAARTLRRAHVEPRPARRRVHPLARADLAGALGERRRLLARDDRGRGRRAHLRGGRSPSATATPRRPRSTAKNADEWQRDIDGLDGHHERSALAPIRTSCA